MEHGRLRGMPARDVCLSVIYKSGLIKTSLSMRGKSPPGSHCVALHPLERALAAGACPGLVPGQRPGLPYRRHADGGQHQMSLPEKNVPNRSKFASRGISHANKIISFHCLLSKTPSLRKEIREGLWNGNAYCRNMQEVGPAKAL